MSSGVVVREAGRDDARAIAAVHVHAWRWGYRELFPSSVLDALSVDEWTRQWSARLTQPTADAVTFVAEGVGQVVGFAFLNRSPDDDALPGTAELQSLNVEEGAAGTGIGRLLMATATERARLNANTILTVWVYEENVRARRFYEAAGFRPDGVERLESHPFVPVVANEVRYQRRFGPVTREL